MIMNFRENPEKACEQLWFILCVRKDSYSQLKTSPTCKEGSPAFLELLAKCAGCLLLRLMSLVCFIHTLTRVKMHQQKGKFKIQTLLFAKEDL